MGRNHPFGSPRNPLLEPGYELHGFGFSLDRAQATVPKRASSFVNSWGSGGEKTADDSGDRF